MHSRDTRHAYSRDYFLKQVDGATEYSDFSAKPEQLFHRYARNRQMLGLQPEHRFLDVGCGRGELVMVHAAQGGQATGIDYAPEAIAIARAKAGELGITCEFIEGSFELLDRTRRYDRILASELIEHISVCEGELFFRLAWELLAPGGRLLVYSYPNVLQRRVGYKIQRWLYMIATGRPMPAVQPDTTGEHYRLYHLNEQTHRSLRRLALRGGFKKTTIGYDPVPVEARTRAGRLFKLISQRGPLRHFFTTDLFCLAEK